MKIARILQGGKELYGKVEGDSLIPMVGDIFGSHSFSGDPIPLSGAEFMAPTTPKNIFCVGLNYKDHIEEMNRPTPAYPNVFMKPVNAIQSHNAPVMLPAKYATKVDYEAEFTVVIGKKTRHVDEKDALNYVLGYTCGNDVSCRNLQKPDNQWCLSKGFDTFAPIGPWIETDLDPLNVKVEMLVNGEIRQSTNTKYLLFNVPYLISYFSHITTLNPGDVILTGTSSGVGQIFDGDVMEVRIEGIGSLINPVKQEIL